MVSLVGIYGNKIFNRKEAYKKAKYIPFIGGIILDFVVAYLIVKIFGIRWDYAVLKMYGILVLFHLARPILDWPINKLNYTLFLKGVMLSEMNHYLRVFNTTLNDDSSYTYDTYLLEAAFDETLDVNMRVLAAINYGVILEIMSNEPRMDNIYLDVWWEAISKFTKEHS